MKNSIVGIIVRCFVVLSLLLVLPQAVFAQDEVNSVERDSRTARQRHEMIVQIGASYLYDAKNSGLNPFDAARYDGEKAASAGIGLGIGYSYRFASFYRMGVEYAIIGETKIGAKLSQFAWQHDFIAYESDFFEFSIGIGAVYGHWTDYVEDFSKKIKDFGEDGTKEEFDLRLRLGFDWRITDLVSLRLNANIDKEMFGYIRTKTDFYVHKHVWKTFGWTYTIAFGAVMHF